ncbi:glycosyltransferase [Microbacterium sp. CnD16-F]|uniref:glycosyltransferase n=1 Tax=Microbacterium sp. CnD16-F TaxID=2954493 RepID=UPI0020979E55|nr:glycosyltransferase [Microbacterium sp. CnD16-F]MCO7203590.1 glycosyltransferase [Microbacterium sp. CnD16-F]
MERWKRDERRDARAADGHNTQVIVAQGFGGHRLMYARLLAEGILERGRVPLILTSVGACDSEEFNTHLSRIAQDCQICELPSITERTIMEQVAGTIHPVVFPEGDAWLRGLGGAWRRSGIQARLLVMRSKGQSSSAVVRHSQTALKALRRTRARLQSGASIYLLGSFAERPRRRILSDPVVLSGSEAQADLLRGEWAKRARGFNGTWVGVVGALDRRKNLALVCEALSRFAPEEVGLVVAGKAVEGEPEIETSIASMRAAGGPIIRIAGVLPDIEMDNVIRAVDLVVLAHSNEGPSGIFGKAVSAGTYVIAAGAKSLKRDVAKVREGAQWTPLDPVLLGDAIEEARARHRLKPVSLGSQRFIDELLG